MKKIRHQQISIIVILLAFLGLGLAASIINPLHEATDELRHYRFVRHIVTRRSLPVQGEVGCSAQGHHPPLFYALGAMATTWIDADQDICYAPETNPFWGYQYWEVGVDNKNQYMHGPEEMFPWQGEALAAHIIRALNILIGAGVVWITWLIGRTIWPERPALALGGVAFVAFNPMFIYMASAINNDVIAAFSGAAVTLACVRLLKSEAGLSRRWGITLGLLYGLALMSKFNLAIIALLIEAVVTWVAWRKQQWRLWWQANLLIALMTLLLAGWWFARNQLLYGEPTGFQRLTELWGVRDPAESWDLALFELPYAWTSLWGRFGYGQIPLPDAIYNRLKWVIGIAFLGLLLLLTRDHVRELRQVGILLLFLLLNVMLFFAVLFSYLLISPAGPMGRFFFPALPSLGILIFYGISQWIDLVGGLVARWRKRRTTPFTLRRRNFISSVIANLSMAIVSIVAIFGFLAPAYARPAGFAADADIPNLIDVQFDTLVRLRGYDLSTTTIIPGETINIDLFWEVLGQPPGNYLLFVHLIDEAGTMVAQRDTHPGLGNFPSKQWQPGDRFVESISLEVPETAYTLTTAKLSIGLYAPGAYRLAVTSAEGLHLGDALELGSVEIMPATMNTPNPLNIQFNNGIRLIGYEYSRRQLHPEEDIEVTLYWQATRAISTDYIAQVRLKDNTGWTQLRSDRSLPGRQSPPGGWGPGVTIQTRHRLLLEKEFIPDSYDIHVTLIDAVREEEQNIIAEDGHWIADHLLLARIRVDP